MVSCKFGSYSHGIDSMVFNALSTSTPHNILSKPLAAFPHDHCRNNRRRRERNELCHKDYHQSSERILA